MIKHLAEPESLFNEIGRMGIHITTNFELWRRADSACTLYAWIGD